MEGPKGPPGLTIVTQLLYNEATGDFHDVHIGKTWKPSTAAQNDASYKAKSTFPLTVNSSTQGTDPQGNLWTKA